MENAGDDFLLYWLDVQVFTRWLALLCAASQVLLSVLWSGGLCAAPKTDVVILVNGDHITGEVKELHQGILSYSTDFMRDDQHRVAQGRTAPE